eukprot:TRINITY_DN4479_c0_g1_i2.p1 TRINITY_DN4479_c0_g1~~TRINITY_DN4479_c0_g1_i2.p1  ORF type:complete len:324 (+),score=48.20 TRINITY_DN4479_c0_g1_i2:22-972(+)
MDEHLELKSRARSETCCQLNEWHLGLLATGFLMVAGASAFFDWSLYNDGVLVSRNNALIIAIATSSVAIVVLCLLLYKASVLRQRHREYRKLLTSEYTRHLYGAVDPDLENGDDLDMCNIDCCDIWRGCCSRSRTTQSTIQPTVPGHNDDVSIGCNLQLSDTSTTAQISSACQQLRVAARDGDVEAVQAWLEQFERVTVTAEMLETTGAGVLINRLTGDVRPQAQALVQRWRAEIEAQSATPPPDFDKIKQLSHLNSLVASAGSSGQLELVLSYLQVIKRAKPTREELRNSGLGNTLAALRGQAKAPARDVIAAAR